MRARSRGERGVVEALRKLEGMGGGARRAPRPPALVQREAREARLPKERPAEERIQLSGASAPPEQFLPGPGCRGTHYRRPRPSAATFLRILPGRWRTRRSASDRRAAAHLRRAERSCSHSPRKSGRSQPDARCRVCRVRHVSDVYRPKRKGRERPKGVTRALYFA